MKTSFPPPLKIKAQTHEDVVVLSALLQDALVPSLGILHDLKTGAFSLLAYRYHAPSPFQDESFGYRVKTYLHIPSIRHSQQRSIHTADPGEHLVLLTLDLKEDSLLFTFANDKSLKVKGTMSGLFLTDTSVQWPTRFTPRHEDLSSRG